MLSAGFLSQSRPRIRPATGDDRKDVDRGSDYSTRADPENAELIRDAYLGEDTREAAERFASPRSSER